MNDSRDIYRKVKEFIKNLYPKEPIGNLARNINTLTAVITGIINGKQTQLPKIALNVPEPIAASSTEMRIKRLIINEAVTEETFFFPFIQTLLLKLNLDELVIAIDASLVGRGCICLMASLIYKNRALPLAYNVYKGKKGHLSEKAHIELVKKLERIMPYKPKLVVLLGDGEFDGINFQQTLSEFGWKYVCRTSQNITINIDDEDFSIDILASMLPEGHFNKLKNCTITKKQYGPVTAIAWWDKGNDEPIYLVTNFISASKACGYYKKRFTIETFFSDQKSRGFHIDKSHLSSPVRLARLLFAACLAYLFAIFLGLQALESNYLKLIHRTDRCDLSIFQLGIRLLTYLAIRGLPLPRLLRKISNK